MIGRIEFQEGRETYEEEEGAEEEKEENGTGEVGVVHYVLVDSCERVEYRQGLSSPCKRSAGPYVELGVRSKTVAYLSLDVAEIHTQLLQQRWLAVIALGAKRREPARSQSTLLAHPPADASTTGPTAEAACVEASSTARVAARTLLNAITTVRSLRWSRVTGDWSGGVGGRVELEVGSCCAGAGGAGVGGLGR